MILQIFSHIVCSAKFTQQTLLGKFYGKNYIYIYKNISFEIYVLQNNLYNISFMV